MKIRLKTKAFINNHLHGPGDIVDLPEGVKGPVRMVTIKHEKIDYGTDPSVDANRILPEMREEPLYEEVKE